jgi:hypothetical protein
LGGLCPSIYGPLLPRPQFLIATPHAAMPPVPDMDYSRPVTPETGVNGSNGLASPRTPKHTGLALTEYSANPSPPSENPKRAHEAIPDKYILPNGTPDVRRNAVELQARVF